MEILTLGHSTHLIEHFSELLQRHDVATVGDVRSVPYSRWNPQFRRTALERSLRERDIAYRFLGVELGARSHDDSCYDADGRVCYARLAATELFRGGIRRVMEEATHSRVALLCAERDPLNCHRAILVAPALVAAGAGIAHILADGNLETHARTLDRLCDAAGMPPRELFRSREQRIAAALRRRGRQLAWVDPERAAGVRER